jgi:hypothetical protein
MRFAESEGGTTEANGKMNGIPLSAIENFFFVIHATHNKKISIFPEKFNMIICKPQPRGD